MIKSKIIEVSRYTIYCDVCNRMLSGEDESDLVLALGVAMIEGLAIVKFKNGFIGTVGTFCLNHREQAAILRDVDPEHRELKIYEGGCQ